MKMISVGESVKNYWLRQNIKLRRGATEAEMAAFEAKHNARLPEDMREFFAVVNGFDNSEGWMVDEDVITFFSLDEIERLNASDLGVLDSDNSYFVFADWSISAHVYAVHLPESHATSHPVVVLYDRLVKVSDSFAEFMQAYVERDESILFPPP